MVTQLMARAGRSPWLAFTLVATLAIAYTFFHLHSAWNPVRNLSHIRAGVVNQDEGVTVDGSRVAVGEDLTGTLLGSNTFGWRERAIDQAKAELAKGELDFYLLIPAETSRLITTIPTASSPKQPVLAIYVNPAFNYPVHQITETLATTLRAELSGKVVATYLDKLLAGMEGAVKGVKQAADGARKLADGTGAANDGAGLLAGGLDKAATGAQQLADGINQVADGAGAVASGTGSVQAGTASLAGGMSQLSSGANQLAGGTSRLSDAARQVSAGAGQVSAGSRELAQGLDKAAAGADTLANGGAALADGSAKLVDGYAQLAGGNERLSAGLGQAIGGVGAMKRQVRESLNSQDPQLQEISSAIAGEMERLAARWPSLLQDEDFRGLSGNLQRLAARGDELKRAALERLIGGLAQLETGLGQARDGSDRLAGGAMAGYKNGQALIEGANRLSTGAQQLSAGVRRASAGSSQLADGAARLAEGAQQVSEGAGTVDVKMQELAAGATKLAGGSQQLAGGTAQLANGARQLAGGTERLRAGGADLASGMNQLRDGGHKLASGLGELNAGSKQLADGLGSATSAALPPRANAPAMSQPVKVVESPVAPVPLPGEALLPVVVPTALWLGALLLVVAAGLSGLSGGTGSTPWKRLRKVALPAVLATVATAVTAMLLGARVAHPVIMLLFTALAMLSFIALNQMLSHTLGYWGLAVSGLLTILMPVAVGARAPYILLPGFYHAVAPFMPLTHAIRGLQAAAAGGAPGTLWISAAVLAVMLGLSLFVSRWSLFRDASEERSV